MFNNKFFNGSSVLLNSGYVSLENDKVLEAKLTIADVAYALSNINRFQGRLRRQVSVAEHSCIMAHVMANMFLEHKPTTYGLVLMALLHDAHEMLIGDIAKPYKNLLADYASDKSDAINSAEYTLQEHFFKTFISYDYFAFAGRGELGAERSYSLLHQLDGVMAVIEFYLFGFNSDDPARKDSSIVYLYDSIARPVRNTISGILNNSDTYSTWANCFDEYCGVCASISWSELFVNMYNYYSKLMKEENK